jgi:hypothetical protein
MAHRQVHVFPRRDPAASIHELHRLGLMGRGAFGFGRYIDRVIHMQIKPETHRIGLTGGGNRYFYRAPAIRQGRFYKIKIKDIDRAPSGPRKVHGPA